ncbi:MAG: hypothetical protein K2X41_09150 [Hyphomicrobium sp.]|nr:hypothetical protein [Hyphomicrobium sp.]
MMRTFPWVIAVAIAGTAAIGATSSAIADSIYEVEGARANARAGGPISEHDAYLLGLYGATSGTPEWRHRPRRETVEFYLDDAPRYYRNRDRHHRHDRRAWRERRVYRD